MWIKSGGAASVFPSSTSRPQPSLRLSNLPPLQQTYQNTPQHYWMLLEKKLDIWPRIVLQYKNKVKGYSFGPRENDEKKVEKCLDCLPETLYNESVDVFKWD